MKPNEIIRVIPRDRTDAWAGRSACRQAVRDVDADPSLSPEQKFKEKQRINNLFYPTTDAAPADFEAAKSFCRRCPVRAECLAYSLVNWEKVGIWGGETETRRRVTRKKMQADNTKKEDAVKWCLRYLTAS